IARLSKRAANQSDALLVGGLSGKVADDLAPEARARDRKRRRQPKVRVVRLLGEAMMQDVIAAVGAKIDHQQVVGEPTAQEIVEPLIARQKAVRRVMGDDGETELASADYRHRQQERDRIRPPY